MCKPEEIKKGLEICGFMESLCVCNDCVYNAQCQEEYDKKNIPPGSAMMRDALAYIWQLETMVKPCEQIRWERDVAIDQLKELGIGFGEKVGKDTNVPRWISVEEELPEDNERVLVWRSRINEMDVFDGRFVQIRCETAEMRRIHGITHWMPLPEPPKEG